MALQLLGFDQLLTMQRASKAGVYDQTGEYAERQNNAPRFEYDANTGEKRGLVIESAKTNLFLYSDDLTNAAWSKTLSTYSGTLLTATAAYGRAHPAALLACVALSTYAVSCEVWEGNQPFLTIFEDLQQATLRITFNTRTGAFSGIGTGVLRYAAKKLRNGRWRIYVVFTTVNAQTTMRPTFFVGEYDGNGAGKTINVRKAQCERYEAGTSHIETLGTAVTRSDDALRIAPNLKYDLQTAFTLAGSFIVDAPSMAYPRMVFCLDDGTILNRCEMYVNNATCVFNRGVNGVEGIIGTTGAVVLFGVPNRFAVSYSPNSLRASINGANVLTMARTLEVTIDRIALGLRSASPQPLGSILRQIAFYRGTMTNAQLQRLSA